MRHVKGRQMEMEGENKMSEGQDTKGKEKGKQRVQDEKGSMVQHIEQHIQDREEKERQKKDKEQ